MNDNGHCQLTSYVAAQPVSGDDLLDVVNPYNGELVGTVRQATPEDAERAIVAASGAAGLLTRYQRYEILMKARTALNEQAEEFAQLIMRESGLCLRETRYETGRAADVMQFAAIESLKDDGQIFSCGSWYQGKAVAFHDGAYRQCDISNGQVFSCGSWHQGKAVVFTDR